MNVIVTLVGSRPDLLAMQAQLAQRHCQEPFGHHVLIANYLKGVREMGLEVAEEYGLHVIPHPKKLDRVGRLTAEASIDFCVQYARENSSRFLFLEEDVLPLQPFTLGSFRAYWHGRPVQTFIGAGAHEALEDLPARDMDHVRILPSPIADVQAAYDPDRFMSEWADPFLHLAKSSMHYSHDLADARNTYTEALCESLGLRKPSKWCTLYVRTTEQPLRERCIVSNPLDINKDGEIDLDDLKTLPRAVLVGGAVLVLLLSLALVHAMTQKPDTTGLAAPAAEEVVEEPEAPAQPTIVLDQSTVDAIAASVTTQVKAELAAADELREHRLSRLEATITKNSADIQIIAQNLKLATTAIPPKKKKGVIRQTFGLVGQVVDATTNLVTGTIHGTVDLGKGVVGATGSAVGSAAKNYKNNGEAAAEALW
jgi:hypothetical protein